MRGIRNVRRAFTLVELIVVITILAILATVGFLSLSGYSDDARTATVKANVRTVYSAILTESTTSGNSPRYYVSHDATAALSGAFVFVDGKSVALTGGDLGVGDSNYTAGNPRWDRLRMNGDKFKLAFAGPGVFGGFGALGGEASAGYSTGELAVGAVDVFKTGANGRKRATPFFQVAGVVAGSKKAVVAGNLASGTADGLVRNPDAANASYSLADGMQTASALPASCKAAKDASPNASDGTYWIDPDGSGGNAEFKAYCDMTTDGGGWTRMLDYAFSSGSTYSQYNDGGGGSWTFSNGYFGANSAGGGHNYKMLDSTGSLFFPVTRWFMKITGKPHIYNTWGSYTTLDSSVSMSTVVGVCDTVNTDPWPPYSYYNPRHWISTQQRFPNGTFVMPASDLNLANKSSDTFFICLAPIGQDGGNGYTFTPAFSRIEAYFR